jgi:hypothetical protein
VEEWRRRGHFGTRWVAGRSLRTCLWGWACRAVGVEDVGTAAVVLRWLRVADRIGGSAIGANAVGSVAFAGHSRHAQAVAVQVVAYAPVPDVADIGTVAPLDADVGAVVVVLAALVGSGDESLAALVGSCDEYLAAAVAVTVAAVESSLSDGDTTLAVGVVAYVSAGTYLDRASDVLVAVDLLEALAWAGAFHIVVDRRADWSGSVYGVVGSLRMDFGCSRDWGWPKCLWQESSLLRRFGVYVTHSIPHPFVRKLHSN